MMQQRGRCPVLVIALACVVGCGDREVDNNSNDVPAERAEVALTEVAFAPALNIVLDSMTRADNGLYVRDVRVGTGEGAERGRTVVIEYSAWLPDGTLYEQRPNAEGFGAAELVLGDGEPRGLHDGIIGMKRGGTRRIVVPPELSYGLVGRPATVPAGSPIVFEVRLRALR